MRAVRFLWLLPLALAFAGTANAQALAVSEAERVSSNLLNYRVLGKNKGGVLVYKHRRDKEVIEAYDRNMALVRRKTLDTGGETAETVNVFLTPDGGLIHFYAYKRKRTEYLEAQRMDARLVDLGEPVLLDSVDHREDGNWDDFLVRQSLDRGLLLVFRLDARSTQLDGIHARVYDAALRPRFDEHLVLDGPDRFMLLQDGFISDRGDLAFAFVRDHVRIKSDDQPHVVFHIRPADFGLFRRLDVTELPDVKIREFGVAWDQRNNRLVGAGFFNDGSRSYAAGVLFCSASASGEWVAKRFETFNPEFVTDVTGRSSRKRDEIPLYEVQDLIVRSDGGVVLVSEYVNETAEAYEYTDYDPYYGGYRTATRYINYHEYEDILLLMIDPDGTVRWDDVIRKRQVSREDYGRNSSFALLNAQTRLFFIFNEDISYDTNVMQYVLDPKGRLHRDAILNADANEVMLVPRKAVQVSGNEIVIPSLYKSNLAFVKLAY
jgi:hypothetical protein